MNSELPKQILLQQKSSCLYERRKLQLVNVAIVGKLEDKEITSMVLEMIKIIDQIPSAIFIDPETYANLKTSNTDIDFNRISCLTSEFYEKVNVVVTIGGDGTILKALSYFQSLSPPEVLSFQKGTLGFLCAFQETDSFHQILKEELAKIYNGDNSYRQTKRRIHGKLLDGKNSEFHVLNDFVITRGNDPHILKLRISILSGKDDAKEHLLTETSGDGLIISTPTGSTAYSLSAGGAVISDNVNSIQMVPICPLSLSFRPIVLPSSVNIKIEISNESRGSAIIWADGQQQYNFEKGMQFFISMSDHDVIFIKRHEGFQDWISSLNRFLNWNNNYTNPYRNNLYFGQKQIEQ